MGWRVSVDDPRQMAEHVFELEAEDELEAKREGYRRAIVADEHGAGLDEGFAPLPVWRREAQAADHAIVEARLDYVVAEQLS